MKAAQGCDMWSESFGHASLVAQTGCLSGKDKFLVSLIGTLGVVHRMKDEMNTVNVHALSLSAIFEDDKIACYVCQCFLVGWTYNLPTTGLLWRVVSRNGNENKVSSSKHNAMLLEYGN